MSTALILQSTYENIEIGLFHQESIYKRIEHKHTASKFLLTRIDELLTEGNITKTDLDYIGLNRGPAPFTTLRVMITTMNGVAYALDKPMVGINGLEAMVREYVAPSNMSSVCLQNAFGHDVYFAIAHPQTPTDIGCAPIDELLDRLKTVSKPCYLIGNGVEKYSETITEELGDMAVIADPLPDAPTLEVVASMCQAQFDDGNIVDQVEPLYLKTMG